MGCPVTIVTPSYEQDQFLEDTLRSVRGQDYPYIEHIVVDGGSRDSTIDILNRYDGTYNLTWLSETDDGQGDAINKGFDMATGRIVAWLNSDDVYVRRDAVSRMVKILDQKPDTDIVYGDAVRIGPDNQVLMAQCPPRFRYGRLFEDCFLVQPATFFRQEVVKEEKLRTDLEYALDYEYWFRLAQRFTFEYVPGIVAGDRIHAERKTTAGAALMREQSSRIRDMYSDTQSMDWRPEWCALPGRAGRRVRGLSALATLRFRTEAPIDLVWPSLTTLLHRQASRATFSDITEA